jgi:hypothetical protein
LLIILLSNILSLCSSFTVRDRSSYTGCGRMDSHISTGNKKRKKQVTEKGFIFSKST